MQYVEVRIKSSSVSKLSVNKPFLYLPLVYTPRLCIGIGAIRLLYGIFCVKTSHILVAVLG